MLLPRKSWETRLCLIVGVVLIVLDCIEIPTRGILGTICPHNRYGCFGGLELEGKIFLFVFPFIIAKIVEFIIFGFKRKKPKTERIQPEIIKTSQEEEKLADNRFKIFPLVVFLILFIVIPVIAYLFGVGRL